MATVGVMAAVQESSDNSQEQEAGGAGLKLFSLEATDSMVIYLFYFYSFTFFFHSI